MERLSLMTLNMLWGMIYQYYVDHDKAYLEENYEEMLDLVAEAGFRVIDITSFEMKLLGLPYLKTQLQTRNIMVSSYIHFDQFARDDELEVRERIEKAKQAVDLCLELESDVLMLVPQAHEGIERESSKHIHECLVRHWKEIATYAREKDVHPVVEDTPDLKLHFCKADDVRAVLDKVPELDLVYDSGNMVLVGENPIRYLKAFAGRIGFVHLKDMKMLAAANSNADIAEDGTPMTGAFTGTGLIDIKQVVATLRETGYQGGMTVEFVVDETKGYLESLKECRMYIESFLD